MRICIVSYLQTIYNTFQLGNLATAEDRNPVYLKILLAGFVTGVTST